jgi:D-ribose pyranase
LKKTPLLNDAISAVIAEMGHTDSLAIGDCGLPIPKETSRIDIALRRGVPGFLETLQTVVEELHVEKAVLASEIQTASPAMLESVRETLPGVNCEFVSHEEFKKKLKDTKCVIRTGECTPYANVILVAGVVF